MDIAYAGGRWREVAGRMDFIRFSLDPYETRGDTCWLWVPSWEDPGGYTLTGKVGDYVSIDSLVYDEDGFHFWVVEDDSLLLYYWDY